MFWRKNIHTSYKPKREKKFSIKKKFECKNFYYTFHGKNTCLSYLCDPVAIVFHIELGDGELWWLAAGCPWQVHAGIRDVTHQGARGGLGEEGDRRGT